MSCLGVGTVTVSMFFLKAIAKMLRKLKGYRIFRKWLVNKIILEDEISPFVFKSFLLARV